MLYIINCETLSIIFFGAPYRLMLELKHQRSENQHLAQHVKSVQSTWPTVHESYCIYHNQPRVLPHLWPEATFSFTVVWMKTVSWLHTRTHTCTNLHMFTNAALLLDSWCFPRKKKWLGGLLCFFFSFILKEQKQRHMLWVTTVCHGHPSEKRVSCVSGEV